nr:hypothetical protein [Tanacetum cinerariifolium]
GTSRSGFLGAATINLVDYADASQAAAISLPLVGSDHGTILHVHVQLLTAKTGFREFEEQRDKGLQSGNNSSSKLEMLDDRVTSKVSASQSPPTEELHKDLTIDFKENHRLGGSLDATELSITELKMKLRLLQSHANEMGNETQKFSQELASEIASGQGLSKEVTFLKSECSKLKTNLKKLTEMKSSSQFMESNFEKSDQVKKVKWVDGVLLVEDQIRNLQEKVYVGSHEPDLRVLKSDLEVLFNTIQDLKKRTVEPESMLPSGELPSPPLEKLLSELDVVKSENENLVKKMNEIEHYYEGLAQELEENQKRILGEFQTLRNEHSACKAETECLNFVRSLTLDDKVWEPSVISLFQSLVNGFGNSVWEELLQSKGVNKTKLVPTWLYFNVILLCKIRNTNLKQYRTGSWHYIIVKNPWPNVDAYSEVLLNYYGLTEASSYGTKPSGTWWVERNARLWGTSLLNPDEGIHFRGLSIPKCQQVLPAAKPSGEPLPKGLLWLLLTIKVPTKEKVDTLSTELRIRANILDHVYKAIDALPIIAHSMTQFTISVIVLQVNY